MTKQARLTTTVDTGRDLMATVDVEGNSVTLTVHAIDGRKGWQPKVVWQSDDVLATVFADNLDYA